MSIILMMLLGLICVQESLPDASWPRPPAWLEVWLGSNGSLVITLGALGVVWLVGSVYAHFWCRALENHPDEIRKMRRRFHVMQRNQFLALTAVFLVSLYYLGWGDFVVSRFKHPNEPDVPGKELALMAPFLLALVAAWARFYDMERTTHDVEVRRELDRQLAAISPEGSTPPPEPIVRKSPWWRVPIEQFLMLGLAPRRKTVIVEDTGTTPIPRPRPSGPPFLSRGVYVGLQARFNLLMIVLPLTLMMLQQVVLWVFPWKSSLQYFHGGFLVLALLSLPWVLRVFLGLRPMPPGPLRDRLEQTIRRLKFRCSGIMLWNTRNSSANAMVTGMLPWPRYIVLTDQLLRDMTPDEVEAVLGHEIGHVKHHHMFYYMLFLFGSLMALGALWEICNALLQTTEVHEFLRDYAPFAETWLEHGRQFQAFPATLALGLYLFFVFGYLSRCCETQADIFGCRTVSIDVFVSALEKVAVLNSIPRDKPGWFASWRHPTIARRVEFLEQMRVDPTLESRFQRRVTRFKWLLAAVLSLLLGAISLGGGFSDPPETNQPRQETYVP